jgi:TonB-dependent SusC/RagA subfamily outer membrane receptor
MNEELKADPVRQQRQVSGRVTGADNEPLAGVTVVLKGTTSGTFTDSDGRFTLMANSPEDIIVFSFIGMQTKEMVVNNNSFLEVTMDMEMIQLQEVVAIGYMTQKKADLTGSVAIVTNEEITRSKSANVFKSLQGKVPGVIIQTDGNPVEDVSIQIRGITSINSSPPLLVIDGLPTTLNMRNINPNDIESIQILKDAASASIYGSRAASGVILITTKQGGKGLAQVSYDATMGVAALLSPPKMLNTQQYGHVLWQAAVKDGLDPNETFQIYDYEWHTDDNVPVLDKVIPVDVYVPGCAVKPEAIIDGVVLALQKLANANL